jgi:lipopolysaccharide/colanic/teichoic acid biosynthesis glycosyltransferase
MNPLPLWKRAIDLACCAVALPVLALLTLVMTIVTKLVSPGPVFFRQERIGHLGRRFKIYKFRTMRVGADNSVHQQYFKDLIGTNAPMVKLDARGDSRLIPGGWLVRALGLDELPQLINVLRGEMSLVGPRPCIPSEFDQYIPWQRQRCDTLPGLTGLWQVSGKNRTTFEQMIRFDIQYAHNLSFWLDLKIILLTLPSLLVQICDTRRARKAPAAPAPASPTVVEFRPPPLALQDPARLPGISEATARRHWSYTRASLFTEIKRLRNGLGDSQEDSPS